MPYEAPQDQFLQPDPNTQRMASAKRLKSAWTSFIISGVLMVLSVVVSISLFVRSSSDTNNGGRSQTTAIGAIAAIIFLRFAYRSYRMYTTWRTLKDAQQAHRSL